MKTNTLLRAITVVFSTAFTTSHAQNDILYAMRGNPQSYFLNPAADVDSRVHLALPSLQLNGQFSFNAGQLIGDPLPEMWRRLSDPSEGLNSQLDVHLFNLGWKYKKSAYWFGAQVNTDIAAYLDHDLVDFALWGMKDANGDIDLNYVGDFSQTSVLASARATASLGWQRQWNQKLKVGAALNATSLVGHAELKMNDLSLASFPTTSAFNRIQFNSIGTLSTYGLIDADEQIDSVGQFFDAIGGGLSGAVSGPMLLSADLGVTYDLTPRVRFMGSYQGLGGGLEFTHNARSLKLDNEINIDGFSWNTADTGVDFLGNYLDTLSAEFGRTLFVAGQTEALMLKPIQRADAAVYWRSPKKVHQFGAHYLYRSRPSQSYHGIAAEYHGFFGRRWQLSGSYTYTLSSAQAQGHSVTAFTTLHLPAGFSVHLGTSAAHMIPVPMTTPTMVQTIGVPASMDRINFTAGLNWMLYEKAYRTEAKARRAAKKAKRAANKAEKAGKKAVQTLDSTMVVVFDTLETEVAPLGIEIQEDKNYYVVVGSFLSQELASKRSQAVRNSRIVQSESKYFRVCLGPYIGTEVRQRLEELRNSTPDAWVVEVE
jgi:Family of unknown function (DUF5723)